MAKTCEIRNLHGSVAAAVNQTFTVTTDARRYDAYGVDIAHLESVLPDPWRYQGRLLASPDGSADLYDAGARFYSPGLGSFTQFDSYAGAAQNPITMNRYLYANANPATFIDPSGHNAVTDFEKDSDQKQQKAVAAHKAYKAWHWQAVDDYRNSYKQVKFEIGDDIKQAKNAHHCSDFFGCLNDGIGGAGRAVGRVITDPGTMFAIVGCIGGSAIPVVGVAVAAGCIGMGAKGLAEQGLDYLGDLGDHGWDLGATARDGWKPYQDAIDNNNYGDFGDMVTSTGLTYASDALMIYGGYRGLTKGGVPEVENGASCGLSFSADTKVATADDTKTAISELKVGQEVVAYDPTTGETGLHTVSAVMVNLDPVIEHLDTDAGKIETTPNHPVFTTDRGWVEAGKLSIGEQIRTESGGGATVLGFTTEALPSTMWDITVEGAHSFFVGSATGVLVHNCNSPLGLSSSESWGRPDTLLDHFERHGRPDFGSPTPEAYAADASKFLQRASRENLPMKVDSDGVIRVYEPTSNTFGSYNPNGTTKTFYKPRRMGDYWAEQDGSSPRRF